MNILKSATTVMALVVLPTVTAAPALTEAATVVEPISALFDGASGAVATRGDPECFKCYEGGLGNPVVCSPGEHFDRHEEGIYAGNPHDHMVCIDSDCTDDHVFCDPGELVLEFAIALTSGNAAKLREMVDDHSSVRIDAKRSLAVIVDCQDRLELTRFRGRLTRPNFGAEVAHEVEPESSTA